MAETLVQSFTLSVQIKRERYVIRAPAGTVTADLRPAVEQWLQEQVESERSRIGPEDALGGLRLFDEAMAIRTARTETG